MNMAGMGLEHAQPVADPPLPEPIHADQTQPPKTPQTYQPLPPGIYFFLA